MKRLVFVSVVCIAVTGTAITRSPAQNTNPPASTLEKPAANPDTSGSGTAPEGRGSTGWTGGAREQQPQSADRVPPQGTGAANDQPAMATGEDLKGPPTKFPARQTPE